MWESVLFVYVCDACCDMRVSLSHVLITDTLVHLCVRLIDNVSD